jgi:uncharacterized protein (DUF885 family)
MRRRLFLSAAAASVAAPALAQTPVGTPTSGSPDVRLRALLDRFYERQLDRNPEQATAAGLDTGSNIGRKTRLSDRSPGARARRRTEARAELADLLRIPAALLSTASRIDRDVIRYALETEIESLGLGPLGAAGDYLYSPYAISQLTGAYQSIPDFLDNQHTIATRGDAEAYLLRLQALGPAIDQDVARLRQDSAAGVVPPDFILETAIGQTRGLRGTPAAETAMVRSLAQRAREARLQGDWAGLATPIVERTVFPALDRQLAALTAARARAGSQPGVGRFRNGRDYYAAAVRASTTTRLTPAEVHRIGREQVAEITAQLDMILRAQGLTAGPVGERVVTLSRRPDQLFPNTDAGRAQLLASLNAQVAEIAGRLPRYFGTLPKAPVEVKRVPPSIQDGAPNGYYSPATLDGSRPGIYWINLKSVTDWPRFALPTLTYHEVSPGHHLQGSIAQESQAIPLIRRTAFYGAHGEGWALYAEQLADEMGMYADNPVGRVGYLQALLYRATRLVVDTGIHDLGWSRERATREFIAATGFPQGRAQREVDRYAAWPGQATSYKVGHNTWVRMREKARAQLGPRFDIRAFHDAVLLPGSVPLTVLEQIVDRHIAERRGA